MLASVFGVALGIGGKALAETVEEEVAGAAGGQVVSPEVRLHQLSVVRVVVGWSRGRSVVHGVRSGRQEHAWHLEAEALGLRVVELADGISHAAALEGMAGHHSRVSEVGHPLVCGEPGPRVVEALSELLALVRGSVELDAHFDNNYKTLFSARPRNSTSNPFSREDSGLVKGGRGDRGKFLRSELIIKCT